MRNQATVDRVGYQLPVPALAPSLTVFENEIADNPQQPRQILLMVQSTAFRK
jgi:hypothetical protein